MAEKCEPIYKNLGEMVSFSDQEYATLQLMQQVCKNDEFLKQFCEKLDYLSSPPVRKRFNPIVVDKNKSYGYETNSGGSVSQMGNESTISFSNKTSDDIYIDFSNTDMIDELISDCLVVSKEYNGEIINQVVLPQKEQRNVDYDTTNMEPGESINAYWYIGYNKEKSYQVRPDWLKDWREPDIHSVCRAQSFKAESSGLLEAITLYIGQTDGASNSNWGCPLYVQIWPVKEVTVNKMKWDKKNKKAVNDSGTEKIYEPVAFDGDGISTIYNPLAEGSIWPDETSPNEFTITFDKPCIVTEGEHYCFVVFSPLSYGKGTCPRIGGWGLNCTNHKYGEGDAFLSENNGRTFMRYGRSDANIKLYKQGKYTPQDFAFKCTISEYNQVYDSDEDNYLYLKPIFTNPITHIAISGTGDGLNVDNEYLHVKYQISTDGITWSDITPGIWVSLAGKPHKILIRAKMWQTSPDNTVTPTINDMSIMLKMEPAKEMYVRTEYYRPKVGPMLGANIWGKLNAPFVMDNDVTCTAEIIRDDSIKESFTVITVDQLEDYVYLNGIDATKVKNKTTDEKLKYLIDNPSVITLLKKHQVYVKPATYKNTRYEFSFADGLQFTNNPAYPIIECAIEPKYAGIKTNYGEWFDYTIDYDTNVLTFNKQDTIDNMPVGTLKIKYNPLFLKNITNEEMPLVLDYFMEEFTITDDLIESRKLVLRCDAVDPIRHIFKNRGKPDEQELVEDIDFIVDYSNHTIEFPIIDFENESSALGLSDVITVIYTPNLEDSGISIGYYAKRSLVGLNKNCKIKPNYIEYKV